METGTSRHRSLEHQDQSGDDPVRGRRAPAINDGLINSARHRLDHVELIQEPERLLP